VRHDHFVVQIDLAALPDDADVLQRMLREVVPELQAENEKLLLLIQRLLRHRFGPRSEKLDLDQLQLVLEDEEQSVAEDEAAQDAAEPSKRRRRTEAANRNRGALPEHLPRFEVIIDVDSKDCPCCGGALHVIGEDRSEQLDIVPSQLRVKVVCRPRYACRACEGAVVQAPAPERPIDGGMATEALIAHVVVSKFCDSLPLYRQAQMLKRQGITLDRSTLSTWVGRACWWLTPLYELVLGTVLSSDKVFADETTLPVLDPGRGKTKTGRLWCYAVDDRPWAGPTHPAAAYVYSKDRRGEHPIAHLAAFRGTLQVDGYAGFGSLVEARQDASIKLAFCWAHMRDDRSTSSTPPPNHRSPLKCWHASASSTRSRVGSAVSHRIYASPFVSCEVDRWSRTCTSGCRTICRACLAGQTWRKPCVMPCDIGTA
jgi:transposase